MANHQIVESSCDNVEPHSELIQESRKSSLDSPVYVKSTVIDVNDSGYFTPSPSIQQPTKSSFHYHQTPQRYPNSFLPNESLPSVLFGDHKPTHHVQHDVLYKESQSKTKTASAEVRIVSPHLIGHFVGRRRIDFIHELRRMDLDRITCHVVCQLTPEELHAACQVSRMWRAACLRDVRDRKRLKIYLAQKQYEKENSGANKLTDVSETRDTHFPLVLLGEAQNRLPNVDEESKIPKEMARFIRFTEEAKNLDVDQLLDKCPRCSSPARVNRQKCTAECRSATGCGFLYCIRCRSACQSSESNHMCDPLSPPRLAEAAARKSLQERKTLARKNLRRLLS